MFQFSADKRDILSAVATVQTVVDAKNTIPVLSNLLFQIDATTQQATVTATNLELGSQTTCAIQTVESGSITIPARKLFEILRELPDAPVTFTVDDTNWVKIECAKSNFRIAGLPRADFPNLPTIDAAQEMTLSGADLAALLNATLFAVSHDESRHALCGVNFDFDNGLTVVATDGHRLALKTQDIATAEVGNMILPLRGSTELKKLCGAADMRLRWNTGQVVATTGSSSLFVRLIEGTFPDYRQVLPQGAMVCNATVIVGALQQTLRRVSLLTSDTRLITLSFGENLLTVSANDPNTGEAKDTLDCQFSDMAVTIGVNARFLSDALQVIPGDTVTIAMNDARSPLTLTCADDPSLTQIIMPMRI